MVESINMVSLKLLKLSTIGDPKLSNYGQMRDLCHEFSSEFYAGKSYGIIGECGAGGWGLVYAICGKGSAAEGEIRLNDRLMSKTDLAKIACYLGEEERKQKSILGFRMDSTPSIKEHLLSGIRVNNNQAKLAEITQLFGLTPEKINDRISQVGNERWNASAAIGYAHGKKIFCFPWLNTGWVKKLSPRISHICNVLSNDGCIILIPTSKEETLKDIADGCIEIHHPDEFI